MKVTGPFRDPTKRGQPKEWYLRLSVSKKNPDGTVVLDDKGRAVKQRLRPYYTSRDSANEDKLRLQAQHDAAGAGNGRRSILTREDAAEFESAKAIASETSLVEIARFWRAHHPLHKVMRVRELAPLFLEELKARIGETAHYHDLKSRVGAILVQAFGDRIPETIQATEALTWLRSYPGSAKTGRTVLNLKQAACNFFNWLRERGSVSHNPFAGIKRRSLPKVTVREIAFLTLEETAFYLRALERYDPELVAHEVVQLLAGVRADDEMANFQGTWVLPDTREVKIPAEFAKTEKREVIGELEPAFWDWWARYGRTGQLRPPNYVNRWMRVRVLAEVWRQGDPERADYVARTCTALQVATRPEFKIYRDRWPWNARRRTFVTYHVAKEQSADKTALIIRHRGDTYTLHNSYRGTGVTQAQGVAYFSLKPAPVPAPILFPRPTRPARGIVRFRLERPGAKAPERVIA